MKNYFNLRKKSKLLLLTLLAVFVGGVSPAWAEAIASDLSSLPEGWTIVGNLTNGSDTYRSGKAVYSSSGSAQATNANYLLTEPLQGEVKFYWRARYTSGSYQNGQVVLYKYDGSVGDQIGATSAGKSSSWTQITISLGDYKGRVAIGMTNAAIDDITYEVYVDKTRPWGVAVSDVTATSATLSWNEVDTETSWQIAYGASEGFNADAAAKKSATSKTYTLYGLVDGTTYSACVRVDNGNGTYGAWSDIVSFKASNEQELTLNNGTSTTYYLPFNGNQMGNTTFGYSQFILPASSLTSVNGRKINRLTFYAATASANWGAGEYDVYLAEVEKTAFSTNAFDTWEDLTNVYSGTLTLSNNKMDIAFEEANYFTYNGGNLLIGFKQKTAGSNVSVQWYYNTGASNSCVYSGYSTSVSRSNYLPKVTITSLPATTVNVTGVSLNESELTLEAGQSETLAAIISPANATDTSVSWESSDEDVATVDNGVVTAVAAGTAIITVTTTDGGFTATCEVTVNAATPVSGVSLNKESTTIFVGSSETLEATVAPDNATNKNITWTSSDETVATVTDGTVNALKAGTATITVTTEDGGKTATCTVTVQNVAVTGITLNESSLSLLSNEAFTLSATVTPDNATIKTVTWKSSDETVATVSEAGVVTAVGNGTATITATSTDNPGVTATCTVTVTTANTLTVYDETSTNEYVPMYGYYTDTGKGSQGQFIIPSDDIDEMEGGSIKRLTFYLSTDVSIGSTCSFNVYVKEVTNTTFESTTPTWDGTVVYNGVLTLSGSQMVIDFDTPYLYNGGNLLIGINQTSVASGAPHTYWYGKNTSSNCAIGGYLSSNGSYSVNYKQFLPKTTFTYIPGVAKGKMVVSTDAIDFGKITPVSSTADKQKTFTIANNTNKADLTSISVTYSDEYDTDAFSLNDNIATSIAAGGEAITVTVTMDAATVGTYNGTITVSADDNAPVHIAVSGQYAEDPATIDVTYENAAVPATVAFGTVNKQTVKTFSITNSGAFPLTITSITSSNTTDFTVQNAPETVAGGETETFDVTFVFGETPVYDEEKTATITIKNSAGDDVTFDVKGTRIEQWSEDFSGNALPEGWENENSNYWTISGGVAKGSYAYGSNYGLITPSLTVEEGKSLSFEARATSTYESLVITMSKNGGDWEPCKTISYNDLPTTMTTFVIDGLTAGNYKFRFKNGSFELDNFEGFKRNANDPKMGIYTDADCTVAAATAETKNFKFATTTQTAYYYIKNDGTGTMTLSKGEDPAGFTATLDKTSVAAGEHATLTITMPAADNTGYHSGNIVVTATDLGTFTVTATGVVVDEDKMYLDFTSDDIPTSWTKNDWAKNASGYIENSTYSSSSIVTSKLTAVAGEELVIEAKMFTTTYTLGVNYKKEGDENWTELIAATNIGTNWTLLHATLEDAGTYQLQFVGTRAQIRQIYGLVELSEPVMNIYDGESLAGNSHNFGEVTDENDATWTLTVKNVGTGKLTGLAAAFTGTNADHYTAVITGATGENNDEIAAGAEATITVTQLKDNLGSHSATLTISANGLDSKVITLSGSTRDHTKLYVDFANNAFPEGWTVGANWAVTSGYAYQSSSSTPTAFVTTPLTVAENETLTFNVKKYGNGNKLLMIRYSQNGGVTWSDYVEYYNTDQATSSYTEKEVTDIPTGNIILEFYGNNIIIDDIQGFSLATAPALALTEGGAAVANGDTKAFGKLTSEDGTATYTLSNTGTADMVSTIAVTGDVTFEVTAMGEGVTKSENTLTIPAGKTATIVVTMAYAAPFSAKSGAMTITTEGWVGDFTINYTGATVDPTALYEDFAGNAKPEGWYNSSWSFSSGYASCLSSGSLITQRLTVEGTEDVLSYDVAKSSSWASSSKITVSYSTDRQNWIEASSNALSSTDYTTFNISGLEAGEYYLKFDGVYAKIDNIIGWHKVTGIDHDLFFVSIDTPDGTYVPGSTYTANVTVANLRAESETVTAQLYIKNEVDNELTGQVIALDATKTFTLTGTVPEEGKHLVKVKVFNDDIAVETEEVTITSAHIRTLAIQGFSRNQAEGEPDVLVANEDNQVTAKFDITVKNTGSIAQIPTVKVLNGETVVGEATAEEELDVDGEITLTVTATNMSAGEGGELSFTAVAVSNDGEYAYETPVAITVNAAAPKFALYQDATLAKPVNDGDDVEFGLTKNTKTFSYVIKNEGTADLELISIAAPEGFTATAVTDANKTIAVSGTLDIDVTLSAEQGKKSGDLVITYKVDATTNKTFTLALSGRSVAEYIWTEDFTSGTIPANWDNSNGWSVYESDGNNVIRMTSWDAKAIITPRLAAANGEELTFDVLSLGDGISYAYSTDRVNWSDEVEVTATGEQTFIAPAAGNYYLRFTGRNAYLDNFVGFTLNPNTLDLDETVEPVLTEDFYETITLSRKFIAGWNTVCLPFEISNVAGFFGTNAKAYDFTDYTAEGALNFQVTSTLEAGKPYIVYVVNAIDEPIILSNTTVSSTSALSTEWNGATFQGTYAPMEAGTMTGLYGVTSEAKIAKGTASAHMKGFRAYFELPNGASARLAFTDEDGTTTIINAIELDKQDGEVYNLNGQRVEGMKKGLYIINGKKVVRK